MNRRLAIAPMVLLVCCMASHANADVLPAHNLLDGSTMSGYESLFGTGGVVTAFSAIGDTYGIEPLVQDAGGAFFISSGSGATYTFDGATELHGTNLTGAAGDFFDVVESETVLGSGNLLIQTEVISMDALGARSPWVDATVTGFTSWRIDVGGFAAAADMINPDMPFIIVNSGVTVYDLTGASLGTFGLAADGSDAFGLSGVGVVGLGGGDIAGFGVSSMQLFWEIEEIVIPEPGTAGLVALAGLGLVMTRRRKQA